MKAFVPMLAKHTGVRDAALLEQDVRLHLLLQALAGDPPLRGHLVFKGGTCLIKCYLGYPRFSTDLDFAWPGPAAWARLGTKELRRALRPAQRAFLDALRAHAPAQGLSLAAEDVVYGQSNRMMTATLRYTTLERLPGVVKVQVNFAEPLHFPRAAKDARSLLHGGVPVELAALDSDLPRRYGDAIAVGAYDAREILAEKGRAVLTRTAAKARDVLDLYLLERDLGLRVEDHVEVIAAKTAAASGRVARYRAQLALADERFELLLREDVGPLLLRPIDDEEFRAYRARAVDALAGVAEELRG